MSLTSNLKDINSPVRRFVLESFPETRWAGHDVRAALAGATTILPAGPVPWALLGTAIDYRLRGYFEPVAFSTQADLGLQHYWGQDGFDFRTRVGTGLAEHAEELNSVSRRLDRDAEDWLCRYCIVLSFFETIYRSGRIPSEVENLDLTTTTADALLAIPQQAWVDDLREQSWAFVDRHADLLAKPIVLNPTFSGSLDVRGADADFILDGCLIEIKATKNPRFEALWLQQLLGYLLLDYDGEHDIRSLGFYFARQAVLLSWSLEKVLSETGGHASNSLPQLRAAFRTIAKSQRQP